MALAVTESADTEDVTLLPTQVAKLGCPCNTKYVWINDSQISTSTCETASDECDRFEPASDVCDGGTCTVVTFRDTLATNSTQIWCDKYGDETSVTVASYFVVGSPLSPNPSILAINASALLLKWEEPFTWKGVGNISHYTVRMYSRSSHSWRIWTIPAKGYDIAYCASVDGDGIAAPCSQTYIPGGVTNATTSLQFILTTNIAPVSCEELLFYVSASNIVGESERAAVRGFFNDAPRGDMKAWITLLKGASNDTDLILNIQSFALVQISAQLGPSKDPITFRIPSGLIPNDTAQLTVTAKTSADEVYVSVTSLPTDAIMTTNFSEKHNICSSDCENNTEESSRCLRQLITMNAVFLATLGALGVCLFTVVFWFVDRRTKMAAPRKEAVNQVYSSGINNLYDYI
eukprot:Em0006g219a